MPKSKNVFGRIKIEKTTADVVRLENGLVMRIIRQPGLDSIKSVTVENSNGVVYFVADAKFLMQAAKVVETIDDGKKFTCGSHGCYEVIGARQPPSCPNCFNEVVTAVATRVSNGEERTEEEDQ